jgi:hypothetical protein
MSLFWKWLWMALGHGLSVEGSVCAEVSAMELDAVPSGEQTSPPKMALEACGRGALDLSQRRGLLAQ